MKKVASLLLGSGFSIPDGLPSVGDINKRMYKIGEDEILIHSSQYAMFLNGYVDNNRWAKRTERLFVQEFLEFYNRDILKNGQEFHYETFYDFYSSYLYGELNKGPIEKFIDNFRENHSEIKYEQDYYNRVNDFNRTFNLLLSSQLHRVKYYNDVTVSGYYEGFVECLRQILKIHEIKIHSLNHDLLFEWLGHHHSDLYEHFCDGFEYEGSPYYGLLRVPRKIGDENFETTYRVKLAHYTGIYNKPICFYKLHGSISNTKIYTETGTVRLKSEYGINEFLKEVYNESKNQSEFTQVLDQVDPDFLSGTTNKTRYYSKDPFYTNLFKHFEKNLLESKLFLVVGYGFRDPGINSYIENNYLSRGKKMIVLDPFKPQCDLFERYQVDHIPCGIDEITSEMIRQISDS